MQRILNDTVQWYVDYFHRTSKEVNELKNKIYFLKNSLEDMKEARARLVKHNQEVAKLLGLPFPAPDKIIIKLKTILNEKGI